MKIKATDLSQGDYKCYLAVMNAKNVFEHSIVSRAEEDSERGYQRSLDEKRANDIALYLNNGNVIPGCIILSAQKKSNFSFENEEITFENVEDAFFVIDGQHRLFGSHKATVDVDLPVYIFTGLEIPEEIQIFLDVNSKQKGVPKPLRIELTKFLVEPDSTDKIRLDLFNKLNTDPESPLFNRLSSTASVSGKISHVPFKESIDPILSSDIVKPLEFDNKYLLLMNFLKAASNILTEASGNSKKLTTTVFFSALFKNFEFICKLSLMSGGFSYETLKKVMNPIANIDFEIHKGTGTAANRAMTIEIKELIESYDSINSNLNDLFSN